MRRQRHARTLAYTHIREPSQPYSSHITKKHKGKEANRKPEENGLNMLSPSDVVPDLPCPLAILCCDDSSTDITNKRPATLFPVCVRRPYRRDKRSRQDEGLISRPAVLPRIGPKIACLRSFQQPSFLEPFALSCPSSFPSLHHSIHPLPCRRATGRRCVGDRFSHSGERSIRFFLAGGGSPRADYVPRNV